MVVDITRMGPPVGTTDSLYYEVTFSGRCYAAGGVIPTTSAAGGVAGETMCTVDELVDFSVLMMRPPHNTILYNHRTDIGPVGYVRRAWVTGDGVLMVSGALYPQSVMGMAPQLRKGLSDGTIRGFSIGWDVTRTGTPGSTGTVKRFVEVSLVDRPYFPDSLLTHIRCSADAVSGYEGNRPARPVTTDATGRMASTEPTQIGDAMELRHQPVEPAAFVAASERMSPEDEENVREFHAFVAMKTAKKKAHVEAAARRVMSEVQCATECYMVSQNPNFANGALCGRASSDTDGAVDSLRTTAMAAAEQWLSRVAQDAGTLIGDVGVSYITGMRTEIDTLKAQVEAARAGALETKLISHAEETVGRLTGEVTSARASKRPREENTSADQPLSKRLCAQNPLLASILRLPPAGMTLNRETATWA